MGITVLRVIDHSVGVGRVGGSVGIFLAPGSLGHPGVANNPPSRAWIVGSSSRGVDLSLNMEEASRIGWVKTFASQLHFVIARNPTAPRCRSLREELSS
jgi:hypothetical protein